MITHPQLRHALASERAAEHRKAADRFRLRRHAQTAYQPVEGLEPIVIRAAVAEDTNAIARIAALESKPVPAVRPVVAVRGGRLEAALDPATGDVLADPFLPSAHAARMVRAHADAELAGSA